MGEWPELSRAVVFPWHCDQYGHMNVRWYLHFFDDAGFHIWPINGVGNSIFEDEGVHPVVARTVINYRRELRPADMVVITGGFVKIGGKSVEHLQHMVNVDTGDLHASQETVQVFFDPKTRTAVPVPDAIRDALETRLIDPGGG